MAIPTSKNIKQVTYNGTVIPLQHTLQSKTVTENGTVTADSGYDGLSSVVVDVSSGVIGGLYDIAQANTANTLVLLSGTDFSKCRYILISLILLGSSSSLNSKILNVLGYREDASQAFDPDECGALYVNSAGNIVSASEGDISTFSVTSTIITVTLSDSSITFPTASGLYYAVTGVNDLSVYDGTVE